MIRQAAKIYNFSDFSCFLWRTLTVSNLEPAGKNQCYISYLAVLPNFQNQGIGTYLMKYAEKKAISAGLVNLSFAPFLTMKGRLGFMNV
jgi:ribosomal protein S18 acetylase RimI-like enzyme